MFFAIYDPSLENSRGKSNKEYGHLPFHDDNALSDFSLGKFSKADNDKMNSAAMYLSKVWGPMYLSLASTVTNILLTLSSQFLTTTVRHHRTASGKTSECTSNQ